MEKKDFIKMTCGFGMYNKPVDIKYPELLEISKKTKFTYKEIESLFLETNKDYKLTERLANQGILSLPILQNCYRE